MPKTVEMPHPTIEAIAKEYCAASQLQFVRFVGEGAFKETFEVRNAAGAVFALKVVRPGLPTERTAREVSAMQQCSHSGVAKLDGIELFVSTHGDVTVLREEFLAGGSLSQRIAANGLLSRGDTISLARLLCDAVSHIASHGLVHRDLKPDNIMFRDGAMSPVVVDFGLVRDLLQSSLTATWVPQGPGTPLFAPPEQLLNVKPLIDWRSDQFSLGILLTVAHFGYHPFAAPTDDIPATVQRVANRDGPHARFLAAVAADQLEPLKLMVSPWPIHRYRTPALLVTAWSGIN
jgi:serine/threonine protein kinase